MKDTTAILMLLSPGFSSLTLPATSEAGVCYLSSQTGNHPVILLDSSVDRKTGFQSNRYPSILMSVLSSWVPESSCPPQHNEGVGVSMQLRVNKSKAVLEVSMLLQGPPAPSLIFLLPASSLHLLTGKLPGAQLTATCFCQVLSAFVLPPNRTFF